MWLGRRAETPYLPCKGEVDSICPGLAPGQMLSGGGPAPWRALLLIIATAS
ncbi:MAG: hypothetical protein QOD29_2681 [Alphaproteobacteria bacterium]|jgi:hypothetical protein|nr:hypothetical protein [Alphaproteobacteria bacterium]